MLVRDRFEPALGRHDYTLYWAGRDELGVPLLSPLQIPPAEGSNIFLKSQYPSSQALHLGDEKDSLRIEQNIKIVNW